MMTSYEQMREQMFWLVHEQVYHLFGNVLSFEMEDGSKIRRAVSGGEIELKFENICIQVMPALINQLKRL